MRRGVLILIVVILSVLFSTLPTLAAGDTDLALDYLKGQQNADGGYGSGFSPESTLGSTADVVVAILAAGGDLTAFAKEGNTPLTYLAANATSAASGGDLSKLILASIAAGENPRQFGGVDSVANLERLVGADGLIGGETDTFVAHTLAVLALSSAQRSLPDAALEQIRNAQQDDGAWAWDGSMTTAADTNTTAFAVQALVAAGAGPDDAAVGKALAYYADIQNDDGGWPYQNPSDFGTDTDANSTAVAIQALVAAEQDPAGTDWTTADGSTPLSALEALQNESGAFAWQAAVPDDNLLATVQALPALAGKALPLATMDVGEPAASAPTVVPETGGGVLGLALPLLLSGLALAAGGYALGRRR